MMVILPSDVSVTRGGLIVTIWYLVFKSESKKLPKLLRTYYLLEHTFSAINKTIYFHLTLLLNLAQMMKLNLGGRADSWHISPVVIQTTWYSIRFDFKSQNKKNFL